MSSYKYSVKTFRFVRYRSSAWYLFKSVTQFNLTKLVNRLSQVSLIRFNRSGCYNRTILIFNPTFQFLDHLNTSLGEERKATKWNDKVSPLIKEEKYGPHICQQHPWNYKWRLEFGLAGWDWWFGCCTESTINIQYSYKLYNYI